MCLRVRACACVRACVPACVTARTHARTHAHPSPPQKRDLCHDIDAQICEGLPWASPGLVTSICCSMRLAPKAEFRAACASAGQTRPIQSRGEDWPAFVQSLTVGIRHPGKSHVQQARAAGCRRRRVIMTRVIIVIMRLYQTKKET